MALVTGLAVMVLAAPAAMAAGLPSVPAQLSWHEDSASMTPVAVAGDDVLIAPELGTPEYRLIDGRTDLQTATAIQPTCTPAQQPVANWPSLRQILLECGQAGGAEPVPVLFAPRTETARVLDPPGGSPCATTPDCAPFIVGAHWIGWSFENPCLDDAHCSFSAVFQNRTTGATREAENDPGGRLWDDPDTPGLTRRLCAPLRVPAAEQTYGGTENGGISFYGRYALLSAFTDAGPGLELAECGSGFHEPLESQGTLTDNNALTSGDAKIIVWLASNHSVGYIDLADRHRGSWMVPTRIGRIRAVTLAGGRVFLDAYTSTWSAGLGPSF